MILWILLASFSVIILGLIIINTKVNGGFKIEASWIAIALAPAVIWLLATGQLSGFTGFGIEFKLKEASAKPFSLSLEGDKIKPAFVSLGEKGGIGNIPELIRNRVAALALQLNRRNYYANWAIMQYLEELTQHDFFRYVVFIGTDGEFRGITQPDQLLNQMRNQNLDLVNVIEEGAIDRLSGVTTVSISTNSSKREALKKMDEQKLSDLPVLNDASEFIGIVERDKLTSSILLQLISQL